MSASLVAEPETHTPARTVILFELQCSHETTVLHGRHIECCYEYRFPVGRSQIPGRRARSGMIQISAFRVARETKRIDVPGRVDGRRFRRGWALWRQRALRKKAGHGRLRPIVPHRWWRMVLLVLSKCWPRRCRPCPCLVRRHYLCTPCFRRCRGRRCWGRTRPCSCRPGR